MAANQWLRLWHDMPNDPKWRTIARISGQPLALIQATYVHLLVDASRNVTRGHATVTQEDLASALDCDMSQIEAILSAMQGRVLDGDRLTGWDARQPKREDDGNAETGAKSALERKRAERERKKLAGEKAARHELSRNVTTDKDTDTDKDPSLRSGLDARETPHAAAAETELSEPEGGVLTKAPANPDTVALSAKPKQRRANFQDLLTSELLPAYERIFVAAGGPPISSMTLNRTLKLEQFMARFGLDAGGWEEYLTCIAQNCRWMFQRRRRRDGSGSMPPWGFDQITTDECFLNVAEGRYDEGDPAA